MKQNKLLKPLLAVLLLALLPQAAAAYDFMVDGLCYNRNDDGTSVTVTYQNSVGTRYSNLSSNLVIPSTVTYSDTTYSVTSIGYEAFFNCSGRSGLTSVTIPNSVTSIDASAFWFCYGLTSVTIPNSVTYIGNRAFEATAWYNNQPDGLVYAGLNAYKYKGTMPSGTVVEIQEGTKSISPYCFDACNGLASVTIPNSVTYIRYRAFEGCSGLTSVTIPNSVTSIETDAFYGCSGLTSVTIGNSVTSIGLRAFNGCSGLTSVTIGNSVTSIGERAFYGCSGIKKLTWNAINCSSMGDMPTGNIEQVTIGDEVEVLPGSFVSGSKITSVTIPNSVTSIGSSAFDGCSSMTRVNIQDLAAWCAVQFVSDKSNPLTFAHHLYINGTEVKDLVIPNSVTSIGNYAFYGCSGLTGELTIPNSVTSIGYDAFRGCSGLTGELTIPNSVTSIGSEAFWACSGLTSVTIPNSVTSIGNITFCGCRGLTSVTIPNSVTSIGYDAFRGCSGLTSVTIPNSVTSIGSSAFDGCSGLKELTWNAINCSSRGAMPTGNIEQVTIGDGVEVLPDNFVSRSKITSVTIPNSVTSIGSYAFEDCSGLTSLTIGNSVTSIGVHAFLYCGGLKELTWNAINCTSMGSMPTYNIKQVTIGDGVEVLPGSFAKGSKITSVTIPNSVTSIGSEAFRGCSGLKTIFSDMNAPQNVNYDTSGGGITNGINKSTCILYVPVGTVDVYRTVSPWNEFENILEWHRATSLDLNDDIELFRFESDQLQVEMHPSNAVEPILIWSSSDNNIVTVDNNGIVTGIAPGTATVVAKTIYSTDVSASCTVTVLPINCDVNHDGTVDVADVNAAINVMLERSDSLTAAECDINGDNAVDIFDVNMIIGEMLGNGNLPGPSAAVKRK